ncbi:MAG: hypothetical protein CVV41_03065 [Candidatus Riflebacteria bacterium HGW-Riflebacteria-1]|jgi:hypothetical protein|nr:MAG: hypothetical protein CVV41_03065 [Candidatus Riflebacteria bacterium HGW-Riflebacteria-1]
MRLILTVVFLVVAVFFSGTVFAQMSLPQPVDNSDLITPVNAQPLSIEAVARRRGFLLDEPSRNLIVFASTGIVGASAALYERCVPRRRIHSQWQGLETVYPSMTRSVKGSSQSLLQLFASMGRRLGMVADDNFLLPGFIQSQSKQQTVDLANFHLALSFSGEKDAEKRAAIINAISGSSLPAALTFADLERLFTQKSSRIAGCFYGPVKSTGTTASREPGFAELVSSAVSRLSVAREGFFLTVNYRSVAEARNKNYFWQMLEHKKIQDNILQQLVAFVHGRRDTLLLVVDEPEAGSWSIGQNFAPDVFVADLKKIPDVMSALASKPADAAAILGKFYDGFMFPVDEILVALNSGNTDIAMALIEQGLNRAHQVSFTSHASELANAGMTIFTLGRNAEMFFGLSSFEDFYRRLLSCVRLPNE